MNSALTKEFERLQQQYPGTIVGSPLRDPHGVYAVEFMRPDSRTYYFAVKNSVAGDTISIHKSLYGAAQIHKRNIIIAIFGDFYLFTPDDIKRAGKFENKHNGATMINFSMKCGTALSELGKKKTPEPELFDQSKLSDKGRVIVDSLKRECGAVEVDQILCKA